MIHFSMLSEKYLSAQSICIPVASPDPPTPPLHLIFYENVLIAAKLEYIVEIDNSMNLK